MFAKALFPTDFSTYANTVFACLKDLKRVGLGTIVLLHVIRESPIPMTESAKKEDLKRVEWSAKEQLNIAQMALEGQGFRVITLIKQGSPVEQILRTADEERVSIIIMGAQGKTLSAELLLGSVSYEVIRHATVPVLIQKAEVVRQIGHLECHLMCEQMFERVLHPTDFSEYADAAFQLVKHLKSAGTQEVILLHVQDERTLHHRTEEQIAEFDREDRMRLENLCRSLRLFGLQARFLLQHGHPVRETLRVADEQNASLIVLGSKGRSAIQEILTGSTLENVIRLSQQPVLVARCPTH
ncbi:MAG: universal stress protein [Anaerolineae bacterium]|nr:MAG: universal stress protein [Anaerolineae bacterium]